MQTDTVGIPEPPAELEAHGGVDDALIAAESENIETGVTDTANDKATVTQADLEGMDIVKVDVEAVQLAHQALHEIVEKSEHLGDFVVAVQIYDNVVDFRFDSHIRGYEGWQWSVTLYHDIESARWTVNESALLPTSKALLAPEWVPWKDRIQPSDISPTDVLGTDKDDERLEAGVSDINQFVATDSADNNNAVDKPTTVCDEGFIKTVPVASISAVSADDNTASLTSESLAAESAGDNSQEVREIVDDLELARTRVLSPLGRSQVAERWYTGPPGPKSLSTRVADGNACQSCGFFIPLQGDLSVIFGVCANKWSQDDGRVVSRDHGCGEHSEIEPPEPTSLWVQSEPTVNDDDIIIVERAAAQGNLLHNSADEDDSDFFDESSAQTAGRNGRKKRNESRRDKYSRRDFKRRKRGARGDFAQLASQRSDDGAENGGSGQYVSCSYDSSSYSDGYGSSAMSAMSEDNNSSYASY